MVRLSSGLWTIGGSEGPSGRGDLGPSGGNAETLRNKTIEVIEKCMLWTSYDSMQFKSTGESVNRYM